jgi:cold shock CspA family protein
VIVSIRETFGFIQPLLNADQIFFSLRDGHQDVAIGDEVSFIPKMTPKGMQADNLRFLHPETKQITKGIFGVIIREPDAHRGTPGMIEIIPKNSNAIAPGSANPTVPFLADDFLGPSGLGGIKGTGGGVKAQRRIVKGDEVECSISSLSGTDYLRAFQVSLTLTLTLTQMYHDSYLILTYRNPNPRYN